MSKEDKKFIVDEGISKIGLKGIYFSIQGIVNKDSDSEFDPYKEKILRTAYEYASDHDIKTDSIIHGFRCLHEAVNVSNRKNISAPENLYKLLLKTGGNIPHINLLVDIYNTISIKYKLALGAHDFDRIEGNIHLNFIDGTENFEPIGETENKSTVKSGTYSYVDDNNEILCYLDVRQVKKTAVDVNTRNVFFIVQGNKETPLRYIQDAANELIQTVRKYCGGTDNILGIVE